jgi:hypothetical protein
MVQLRNALFVFLYNKYMLSNRCHSPSTQSAELRERYTWDNRPASIKAKGRFEDWTEHYSIYQNQPICGTRLSPRRSRNWDSTPYWKTLHDDGCCILILIIYVDDWAVCLRDWLVSMQHHDHSLLIYCALSSHLFLWGGIARLYFYSTFLFSFVSHQFFLVP